MEGAKHFHLCQWTFKGASPSILLRLLFLKNRLRFALNETQEEEISTSEQIFFTE